MIRNETRLMESAIALAEELHYGRAARKLGISQPMLTKNIQDLESLLGGPLFLRDRKSVVVTDAGRAYVQQARLSLLYGERAFNDARAVLQGIDMPLHIGRSPHVDPYFVTVLLSLQLPLYPRLKIDLSSQYSVDLVHDLLGGALDFAIANGPPESPLLTQVQIGEAPFYIGMSRRDPLSHRAAITWEMLSNRKWLLFDRRLHPILFDEFMRLSEANHSRPDQLQAYTTSEEAFPFILEDQFLAIVAKPSAVLLARQGVTVRPLNVENLSVKTFPDFACRQRFKAGWRTCKGVYAEVVRCWQIPSNEAPYLCLGAVYKRTKRSTAWWSALRKLRTACDEGGDGASSILVRDIPIMNASRCSGWNALVIAPAC